MPTSQVYDVLATEEGVARAFAKLDTIKDDIVWWEAGAQPPQLLADGEVVSQQPGMAGCLMQRMVKGSRLKWFGTVKFMTSTCG